MYQAGHSTTKLANAVQNTVLVVVVVVAGKVLHEAVSTYQPLSVLRPVV